MEGVQLKRKVTLRRKEKPAEFTFTGLLKVKLLWQSSTDLDLCLFFKKKDGEVGGVFSSAFRQKKSDLGSLTEFPYMLHKGDEAEPEAGGESVEQINIANLNEIDTAYVCVLNYGKAIEGEEVNSRMILVVLRFRVTMETILRLLSMQNNRDTFIMFAQLRIMKAKTL